MLKNCNFILIWNKYDLYSSDLRFFCAYTFGTFFALKCGQKPCKSVNGNLQAKTVVLRTAKRPSRHTTSYDVDIRLDLGRDVRWPKFNVKPTSNDNVKLTSKTDVIWRWYLVVFRLCCKVTKIQRRTNVSSQRHIDVKYWYLVVRYGNQTQRLLDVIMVTSRQRQILTSFDVDI